MLSSDNPGQAGLPEGPVPIYRAVPSPSAAGVLSSSETVPAKTSAHRPRPAISWLPTASLFYFYGALIVFGFGVALGRHPPLLQDYPTWVYEGVAFSHVLAGHPDPQFMLKHFPVPNVLSDIGLGVLSFLLPWQVAAKLWVLLYLVVSAFAFRYFLRATPLDGWQANWIAPSLGIVNLCFWWGFIDFLFGTALMVLFCGMLLRNRVRILPLAALLIVVFLSHAIPFAVCGIALLSYVLLRRCYRLLAACVPVFLLGTWYVYGRYVLTGNRESYVLQDAHAPHSVLSFVAYKANCYFKSLGYVHPQMDPHLSQPGGPAWLAHSFLIAVTALLGLALLCVLAVNARAALTARTQERFLWITVAAVLAIGLLCPAEALGVSDPGSRFIVCALILGLLCSRPVRLASPLACAGSCILGVAGCALFLDISLHAYGLAALPPPQSVSERFAHVGPQSRAYYYRSLDRGSMDLPTFDTAIFMNRTMPAHPRQ